jgi:CHAD domain-containing protein
MAYRIRGDEAFSKAIRRIAVEQIDKALENLKPAVENKDEAVHDARVCIKKIRALLRLVRQSLGEKLYKAEDKGFRNTARLLSKARDSAALLEIFSKLNEHFSEQLTDDAFAEVKSKLSRAKTARADGRKTAMAEAAKSLRAARRRVKDWPKPGPHTALTKGLKQVFKLGRENFHTAYAQPAVETFHEWRKQVKHLLFETAMLKSLWPKAMKASKGELKHLGELLSDDHDLAILRKRLVKQIDEVDETEIEALMALIDQRRNELQITAKSLGARVYAEKPNEFANRIDAYWDAWRAEVKADPIAAG